MIHELQPGDPQLIGPYRLRGRLGAGGMGQVFLGRSAGGRPVAVKVVRAHLATDPEFRERFRREINVARKVSGVYTSPVIDADVDGPMPWLATAYVEGPSLAEAVSEHGPLPPRSVLALAAGLAEGLNAIHAAGVGPFGTGSTPALVYRVVYSPPNLDHLPIEVRPLIERCLAKDPAQRPTAAQLLAEAGAVHPATACLPEPVTRTFIQAPQGDAEPGLIRPGSTATRLDLAAT